MAEDMKDEKIQNSVENYLDGVEAPALDLSAAKAEMRRRRRRGRIGIAAAAAACFLLVFSVVWRILPAAGPAKYSAEHTERTAIGYTELTEKLPALRARLARLSLSRNASANYTLCSEEGEDVLLLAEVGYSADGEVLRGQIAIELTARRAEEYGAYADLPKRGDVYRKTTYEGGEYLTQAMFPCGEYLVYCDLMASSAYGCERIFAMFS